MLVTVSSDASVMFMNHSKRRPALSVRLGLTFHSSWTKAFMDCVRWKRLIESGTWPVRGSRGIWLSENGASLAKSNTLLKLNVGRVIARAESLSACSFVYPTPNFMLWAPRVQDTTSDQTKLFWTKMLGPHPTWMAWLKPVTEMPGMSARGFSSSP
jgi:hypothetical protein